MQISWIDITVVVIYFAAVLLVGLKSCFVQNRDTLKGYFLAGRFMTWFPIGASLFASNIGSEHFIGLAGSGAANGIGVGAFELNASLILQLLGWVFLPVYLMSEVCTLPEYMKKRFNNSNRIQVYLAVLSLILYIFTKISVNLYAGWLFINEALGWNLWYSMLFILALTTVITITGGLTAVLYTDTLQCVIMVVGAASLCCISWLKIGSFSNLIANYTDAVAPVDLSTHQGQELIHSMFVEATQTSAANITQLSDFRNENITRNLACRLPSKESFVMLRDISDPDMPWLGFLLGQTPASIWYWCADQMMVQRVLSAKSLSHSQGATLFAGMLKQLPLYLIIIPGMIARVLFPEQIMCGSSEECLKMCGQPSGCSNLAYPKLVMNTMPDGLRGLMLSVMLAALISDLTSIFNSASTLYTMDIHSKIRPAAQERELMIVGKLFVVLMVLVSVAWVPVIQTMQSGRLFIYIQAVSANLAPPIAAVFLLAILWHGATEAGAFYSLMVGLALGLVRFVLDCVYREPECGDLDTRPLLVSHFHYMYFAMLLFLVTVLVMVVVSFLTRSSDSKSTLTYFHAVKALAQAKASSEIEIANLGEDELQQQVEGFLSKDQSRFVQTKRVKIILTTGLVVISLLTVTTYVFFSCFLPLINFNGPLGVKLLNASQNYEQLRQQIDYLAGLSLVKVV